MSNFIRDLKRRADLWSAFVVFTALVILAPLGMVLAGALQPSQKWQHLASTMLSTYVLNTLVIVFLVSLISCIFAIVPAWLVATCEFRGRKVLEWALVLPLALPTYVAAFAYFEIQNEGVVPLLIWIRKGFGIDAFLMAEKVIRYGMLAILLASVLSPYLYITVRASFSKQSRAVIESARMLGRGMTSIFFTIAIPMARPAIVAGLSLVIMEVINDYGAVHFFGVPTSVLDDRDY
ncbi:MAG: ABC transporter permease subunit [Verrucomicrobiota bacterium]